MVQEVIWTQAARNDLRDIFEYISAQSPFYAETVVERIVDSARTLGEFPLRGRVVPELRYPTIREVFAYQYRVLYQIKAESIYVIGILHMARDFDRYFYEGKN